MTTTHIQTTGIPLYKFNGETFCKMIDVLKLIHHESYETDNDEFHRILDRMEMRVSKNDFLLPDAQKPTTILPQKSFGRYAVGYQKDNKWFFYHDTIEGTPIFTQKPCKAKLYTEYRTASACADFLDEEVSVLDFEENSPEEERWQRQLLMPFPYDWDEGNYNAIPVKIMSDDKG